MATYRRLDDVCNINMGQSPASDSYNENGDGLPFFQGNADFGELYPRTRIWCNIPTKIVEPETILISVRAPIGALNFSRERSCIGRGLAGITPMPNIELKYIYYCLKSKNAELNAKGTGSTFKAIAKNALGEVLIRIVSTDEQQQIVRNLDKVASVIAWRKQQLAELDTLIKARFVEMFGTFPANEKGWNVGTIRDVITEARYGSSRPAVEEGRYPYLRMNNITYDGKLDLTDVKRIDIPENELPKCTVRRGDVLFNRTNSKELVGKTCVYDRDEMMVLAGFVIRVRVNELILPEFLSAYLNTDFSKQMLLGMCKTAIGQANINAQEMQSIGLYIPPIKLQQEFASFVAQVDKSRVVVQQALDEAQLLFDSLMQQYFG